MIDDEFGDFDIFDYFNVLPQAAFESSYRAMLLRFESELEGREPPHAVASRDCIKLLSLWSLSLLKKPSGHGIGLPMKAMADDFVLSNRALFCCDPVCVHRL